MYLHTGNNRIVFHRELIGIFNYKLCAEEAEDKSNNLNCNCLKNLSKNKGRNKSIIVTDQETYSSPISPLTLAGRNRNDNNLYEE
jgi:hypothetical protein